ncbi:transposase [Streptomyces sp. NPDC015139]|uniref:transposase n=1 Tax=Streptomyces sp. NPDC015139 TaxID=3364942 RepID=UPI0036F74BE4
MARPTPTRTSTLPSRWTPRSCGPISTRPEPANRGSGRRTSQSRHRTGRWRTDHEDLLGADGSCRPLALVLTAGQAGNAPVFTVVMARLRVARWHGRPRTRPDMVVADKAYASRAIRDHPRKRGIRAVIPIPADQRGHRLRRGSRGGGRSVTRRRPRSTWLDFTSRAVPLVRSMIRTKVPKSS